MGKSTEMMTQEEGRRELRRLLHWITENREKWQLICNQEFLELPVSEELALVESLKAAGLYSVAYVLFNTGWSRSQSMEAVPYSRYALLSAANKSKEFSLLYPPSQLP